MKIFLQKVILVMQNLQILMRIFCKRTMTIKTCINYLTIDAVKTCMEGGGSIWYGENTISTNITCHMRTNKDERALHAEANTCYEAIPAFCSFYR